MKFILYLLIFESGKCYIGQTNRSMHLRKLQHIRSVRNGSMLAVHCAWRKYGMPLVQIIGEFENQKKLNRAEIKAIKDNVTYAPYGYNIAKGGETAPSKTKSVAIKISSKAKGRKHSDKVVSGMRKTALNLWEDERYRKKVLDGVKKHWAKKDSRHNHSVALSNSWTKERRLEHGKIQREAWIKRKAKGYKVTDETRKKMSESAKKRVNKSARNKNNGKFTKGVK